MIKHTILFLSANPRGGTDRTGRDALDQEASAIHKELKRSDHRDRFELVTRWAAEPLDLLRELRELKPTIVHFCGHGGKNGLWFQAPSGDPRAVSPDAIAEAFDAAGGSVQLVVLSACYSEPAAEALLAYVDCVVGMPGALHDEMARAFATGFYGALGDQESVAAAYQHGNAAISLEGTRVPPETDRPQLKVRTGADAAQIVPATEPTARVVLPCPYPGLAQFTAANRDLLFGRDKDKGEILLRIRAGHGKILVVGPSGSGKSSLIHAAVLPELAPSDHVIRVVPRGSSLAAGLRSTIDLLAVPELGAALDTYVTATRGATDVEIEDARTILRAVPVPDAQRRVVVVDPLEEIFAVGDDNARATLFSLLDGLWSLPWCTVILCMRADFYGELMVERCWRELKSCQHQIAPLDDAGLRAAIVEPAICRGVQVDDALVERLIREIDRDRSSVPLPLLQVALKELWANMRWRYLTLADYERIVKDDQRGLAAVLAAHAGGVLQRLTAPGDQVVAQRILIDLVHLGEGRPHTRRRRTLEDLQRSSDRPGQLKRALDVLIAGRLVTANDDAGGNGMGGHVDLAHDALITGWPWLAGWIAEFRPSLQHQRRLESRATDDYPATNSELAEYRRWLKFTDTTALGKLLAPSNRLRTKVKRNIAARRKRYALLVAMVIIPNIVSSTLMPKPRNLGLESQVLDVQLQQVISTQAKTRDRTLEGNTEASETRDRALEGNTEASKTRDWALEVNTDAFAGKELHNLIGYEYMCYVIADQIVSRLTFPEQDGAVFEIRAAQHDMNEAAVVLHRVLHASTTNESVGPAVKSQNEALQHLANARLFLQPLEGRYNSECTELPLLNDREFPRLLLLLSISTIGALVFELINRRRFRRELKL